MNDTRSTIHIIGETLSLEPCRILNCELIPHLNSEYSDNYEPTISSFADVLRAIHDGEASYLNSHIIYGKRRKRKWSFPSFKTDLKYIITALRQNKPVRNWSASKISTARKAAVLEDELAFLSSHCRNHPSVEEMSISATSGLSVEPNHFPGLVLPPLLSQSSLQPPCFSPVQPNSTYNMNNRASKMKRQPWGVSKMNGSHHSKSQRANDGSNMLNALKDMNKVKLWPTGRSPGGRPIRKRRQSLQWDPVSLTSNGHKQKFAFQDDFFDKENRSWEYSPFSSPEMSRFWCHIPSTESQWPKGRTAAIKAANPKDQRWKLRLQLEGQIQKYAVVSFTAFQRFTTSVRRINPYLGTCLGQPEEGI